MKKLVFMMFFLFCNLYASASFAACARADLTGTWRIYLDHDSGAMRCTLVMPASGTAISSSSYCYIPGVSNSSPLSGSLSLDLTNCRVFGSLRRASGSSNNIDAWISKGKDSIAGMWWNPSAPSTDAGFFSGVKQ